MKRAQRIPECHPDLPHRARGLCNTCYVEWRRSYQREIWEQREQRDDRTQHKELVRVQGAKGWGWAYA